MPLVPLPVIKSWMGKIRGWRADVWAFLNNIQTNQTELMARLAAVLAAIDLLVAEDMKPYNIRIVVINKEYSQRLPNGTKAFDLKTTDGTTIRFAFESGRVADAAGLPVRPYSTLAENETYSKGDLNLVDKTIYFACSTSTPMVELICYI